MRSRWNTPGYGVLRHRYCGVPTPVREETRNSHENNDLETLHRQSAGLSSQISSTDVSTVRHVIEWPSTIPPSNLHLTTAVQPTGYGRPAARSSFGVLRCAHFRYASPTHDRSKNSSGEHTAVENRQQGTRNCPSLCAIRDTNKLLPANVGAVRYAVIELRGHSAETIRSVSRFDLQSR